MRFDRIGVVSWVGYRERLKRTLAEIDRIGLTSSGVDIDVQVQFGNPFEAKCFDTIKRSRAMDRWPYMFDCTMGHYSILKRAQRLGTKNLLVMEDDCRFMLDPNESLCILRSIPEDYSLALAECWPILGKGGVEGWLGTTEAQRRGGWRPFCGYEYRGASCYAVSADGIDRLIRLYERCLGYGKWKDRTLMVCDQWFSERYMKPERKCYFAYPPAGIQQKTEDTVTKAGFDIDARYRSFGIDTSLYREDF